MSLSLPYHQMSSMSNPTMYIVNQPSAIISGQATLWFGQYGGGAIVGAIAGGGLSTFQYTNATAQWSYAGGRTAQENMIHHFNKHVIGDGHNYLG